MTKRKLAYIWSLRNAAADKAGQYVPYKGEQRYMKSVLESLVEALNQTALGDAYELVGVIYDDDAELPRDQGKIKDYGFAYRPGQQWFYPADLQVQGKTLNDLLLSVPSTYRRYPRGTPEHVAGKSDFERRLHDTLVELGADVVVLDGLLVILDELVRPGAPFARRIMNIHPGVTREDSPYERRGAYATLDALYGARGEKVVDWATMEKVWSPSASSFPAPPAARSAWPSAWPAPAIPAPSPPGSVSPCPRRCYWCSSLSAWDAGARCCPRACCMA